MFEKNWHVVALIIALLVCCFFLVLAVKDLNMKGIACLKKPACPISIYDQQIDIKEAQANLQKLLEYQENDEA